MVYTEERKGGGNPVELYIDSYIVTCFWLHFLCLKILDMVEDRRIVRKRCFRFFLAALGSTVTDVLVLLVDAFVGVGSFFVWSVVTIAEFLSTSMIAFGRTHVVRNGIGLFGVTALLAGIFQLLPVNNIGLYCCIGSMLLPILKRSVTSLLHRRQTECMLYEAKLIQNGKVKEFSAFMDTGNRLRLFGSTVPVVVVDEKYITDWIKEAECFMPQKLVVLPYKGVGGTGLLQGVRVQCTLLSETGERTEREVAAVAAGHKLFQGCAYQMILQPEVIQCVKNTQEGAEHVV